MSQEGQRKALGFKAYAEWAGTVPDAGAARTGQVIRFPASIGKATPVI